MPHNDLTPKIGVSSPGGRRAVDSAGEPADDPSVNAPISFRRVAAAGLALVVLVSSLTCMTVACRVVCAAGGPPDAVGATAPADLPPCHRAAGDASGAPTRLPAGDCSAGTVCCSTWLHEKAAWTLPAPGLVRGPLDDDAPVVAIAAIDILPRADQAALGAPPPDPPLPSLEPASSPRASRAPPAA